MLKLNHQLFTRHTHKVACIMATIPQFQNDLAQFLHEIVSNLTKIYQRTDPSIGKQNEKFERLIMATNFETMLFRRHTNNTSKMCQPT